MHWITEKQFGTAGLAEQDDGENWSLIGNNLAGRGPQIHKLALNYQMGLGHEEVDESYPGEIIRSRFAESAQRMFYRRWLEFMTSKEWPTPAPVVRRSGAGTFR
jgi:hypothetical protein